MTFFFVLFTWMLRMLWRPATSTSGLIISHNRLLCLHLQGGIPNVKLPSQSGNCRADLSPSLCDTSPQAGSQPPLHSQSRHFGSGVSSCQTMIMVSSLGGLPYLCSPLSIHFLSPTPTAGGLEKVFWDKELREMEGEGFQAVLIPPVLEVDNVGLVGRPGMAPCTSEDNLSTTSGPLLVGPAADW